MCVRMYTSEFVSVSVCQGERGWYWLLIFKAHQTARAALLRFLQCLQLRRPISAHHRPDSDSVLVPLLYWRAGWGKYSAAVSFYFCELCIQAALRKASFILLAHANSLANISNISVLCWHYAYFSSDLHFNNLYTPFLCFGGWKYAARSSVWDWCTMFSRARLII